MKERRPLAHGHNNKDEVIVIFLGRTLEILWETTLMGSDVHEKGKSEREQGRGMGEEEGERKPGTRRAASIGKNVRLVRIIDYYYPRISGIGQGTNTPLRRCGERLFASIGMAVGSMVCVCVYECLVVVQVALWAKLPL
jgi:hypothetical protein